jgi:N-methylhydantoinase A/oxoprolinase/acetone carboxylase beta subunit
VPRHPGVLSAAGLLAAPVEHEAAAAFAHALADVTLGDVRAMLGELDRRCDALMAREALGGASVEISYAADLCYAGQAYHLEVTLQPDDAGALERLYRDFLAAHARVYGHATENSVRFVNLHAIHRAGGGDGGGKSGVAAPADETPPGAARAHTTRDATFAGETGPRATAVFARDALGPAAVIDGPAIIEQTDTTTLIAPGWRATVAAGGALLLTRAPGSTS